MKRYLSYFLLFNLCLSCQQNELQMYSGENSIQIAEAKDSVQTYSFYFNDPKLTEDTVWLRLRTTGYVSDKDRCIKIEQVEVEGHENAIVGTHYKVLEEKDCLVPAHSVFGNIPVILLKKDLKPKTVYTLKLILVENKDFKTGEENKLTCTINFSEGIIKPAGWTEHISNWTLGEWGFNKHEWLIQQTGYKWDDDFFKEWTEQPGLRDYWKGKVNELLVKYNQAGNVLLDDNGVEIKGFPN